MVIASQTGESRESTAVQIGSGMYDALAITRNSSATSLHHVFWCMATKWASALGHACPDGDVHSEAMG